MATRLLSQREACARAGISLSTLLRLLKRGEGPPVARIGSRRLLPEEPFEAWLASRVATRDPPPAEAAKAA